MPDVWIPDVAADAIREGRLDGAGFARQFLADQEWVTKLMDGQEDDIRPCILCHNGCFNMCHYKGVPNDQASFGLPAPCKMCGECGNDAVGEAL